MAKRIGFLGPAGTYTEEVALAYDPAAELVPYPSIPAVGQAVLSGATEEGVVPIENSLEGSVTYTLDLLISQAGLSIRREMTLPIEHFLMAQPGTRLEDVQCIYSHPQALAQCRGYLERQFPNAQQSASLSTVTAVADMKASPVTAAAIAPRRAADLMGVAIVAQNIQDNPSNVTRFVALARHDHAPTGDDKTSLCFSFDEDRAGLLYRAIGIFAERNINLTKVESRPNKQTLGRYIFLIDCEGHRQESPVREALAALEQVASRLRVFGSYPRCDNGNGKK